MAKYSFNANKYQNTFNGMFGQGSYSSSLDKARAAGRRAAQAELALKAMKERQREEERRREQSRPDRYTKHKEDYYDEQVRRGNLDMEDVPDGKLRSEVARNKMESIERMEGRNADVLTGKKYTGKDGYVGELDGEIDSTGVMRPTQYRDYGKKKDPKTHEANSLFDFISSIAYNKLLTEGQKDRLRGNTRFLDNVIPGDPIDNFTEKYVPGINQKIFGKADSKIQKAEDVVADLGGYALPGTGAAKALRLAGLGAKANTVGQLAKEGALVGGLLSGTGAAVTEGINPDRYTTKQHLANIGLETAGGAILDPAISKGVPALFKTLRGMKKSPTPQKEVLALPPGKNESLTKADVENVRTDDIEAPFENVQERDPFIEGFDNAYENVGTRPKTTEQFDEDPFVEDFAITKQKDISGIDAYYQDLYRNFEDALDPKTYRNAKTKLLDPFDASKGENIDLQEKWINDLKKNVVDKLGIKKGSEESKLVQMYGEKEISLNQLKQEAPDKWKDIVRADQWFRQAYDTLLDRVNKVRARIYPNNPDKLVPKRKDYYRHFRELDGLEGFMNMFDTPAGIDPSLVGTSEFTKPNTKWASFAQKRGLGPYKRDAVGGFLEYLPAASYAIKIDPHIPKFKKFTNELRETTTGNLNNFINFLDKFTQDLSGKTNPGDRFLQEVAGRKTFNVLNWLNKRVKKNMILGNAGSALAQIANVPTGISYAKQYSIPGVKGTLRSIAGMNPAIKKSDFMKERFGRNMYNQFESGFFKTPEKFAGWVLETVDKVGTSFIWNSSYEKALAQGVKNPIKQADDITRKLVAGRGIGEVPIGQKSKVFQMLAPFQLEVANLWKVQKDFVKARDFGALISLYLGSYILNKGMEEVRGSGVTFDPIDAIIDAISAEDASPLERGGRLAGEVLSNVPLGQNLAAQYPEYGFDLHGHQMPTRKELFGDKDPTRFGSGLLISEGLQNPLTNIASPFGGRQFEKTYGGIEGLFREGMYNNDGTKLKYPVDPSTGNIIKGSLFGPSAFNESSDYYDNERRPLSENQTSDYLKAKAQGQGQQFYNGIMETRDMNSIKRKMKELREQSPLSEKQQDKMNDFIRTLRSLKAN